MTTRLLHRIAAVLILLFDLGHSAGYPWSDPEWRVDTTAMRSSYFQIFGSSRTYWHFYSGGVFFRPHGPERDVLLHTSHRLLERDHGPPGRGGLAPRPDRVNRA